MSNQDSKTVSKSPGVGGPAVALPHQAFYPNSGVNSPARFATNYDSVMQGLPYKPVGVSSAYILLVCLLCFFVCRQFSKRLHCQYHTSHTDPLWGFTVLL